MSLFKIFTCFVLIVVFLGCISHTKSNSKKIFKDGVNMLYGEISREDLFSEYPAWEENYEDYQPDSLVIKSIPSPNPNLKVEIFLGTWCSDSRREVPRFFKIVDESKFVDKQRVKIWAVDRDKSLDSDLTEKRKIVSVSTFIFYRNNTEIGRIVEMPENENIESDILMIVQGN